MKSKIQKLLVIACVWTVSAQAHVQVPNLWSEYERQQKWEAVQVEVEGVQGSLRAYLTEGKQLQFDGANGSFRSTAKIESPTWGIFNSRASFKEDCRLMEGSIERVRSKKQAFSLSLGAVPLSNGFYTVVHANGTREQLSGPANTIELLNYFSINIKQSPNALIASTMPDLDALKIRMLDQIGKQKQALRETGQLNLDLTAYDDLVCDLLNNEVEISITMNTKSVQPKLTRIPFFKGNEIEKIYGEVTKRNADLGNRLDAKVLNSAYLALALGNVGRDIDQLDTWEYDKLFGMLFDRTNGRLLSLGNPGLREVSRAMDRFDSQTVSGTLVFNLDLAKEE